MRYYLNPKVNHSQLGYEGMGGGGMLVKQRALTGAQSAALALSQVRLGCSSCIGRTKALNSAGVQGVVVLLLVGATM